MKHNINRAKNSYKTDKLTTNHFYYKDFSKYSEKDSIYHLWQDDPEIKEDYKDFIVNAQEYLHRLPCETKDVITLYYYKRKTEKQIAKILGLDQSAVSQRIKRMKKRIKYLIFYNKVLKQIQDFDELKIYFGELDRCLFLTMIDNPGITLAQRKLSELYPEYKFTYSLVRYNWLQIKLKLNREVHRNPSLKKYITLYEIIEKHYNVLDFKSNCGQSRKSF